MTDTGSGRSLPRRLRDAVGVVGLVYLVLCAALLGWALVVTAGDSSGESMAGVIPVLVTAPAGLVLLVLPDGAGMLVAAVVLGALVNAAIIGWCTRALRRGGRPDPMA
ncbi:SCO4225 family membrane protein [Streptomyces sp. NPDC007264]|uniref:SCO4225 family membrane protein n=1 Tax=Streptomyces sp. NPDC007264 TaxID=3364777 RepID=UPI0036D83C68